MSEGNLHKIWWLWLPLVFIAVQVALEYFLPHHQLSTLLSENGPHETLQALTVFAAFLVAVATVVKIDIKNNLWLAGWVGLAAICCLYVAGEEISWGQHVLAWSTPEFWTQVNDQGETNLHNTSSWLDQKPRLILEIGIVIGGLIIPLLLRFKPSRLPQKFNIIYPPAQLCVVAALAVSVKIIEKIDKSLSDVVFMERASEVEELYLFYFVLLYLIVLRRRILQYKA